MQQNKPKMKEMETVKQTLGKTIKQGKGETFKARNEIKSCVII